MRITRIHTPQTIQAGQPLALEEQASLHLSRVLRMRLNDTVRVFNGLGGEFEATITDIGKKQVSVLPGSFFPESHQSPLQTHIAIGVSKGDKMDLIVQKCTELGVNNLYPIITERCDVKLDGERWQKKVERWQEIAISACEQSGRNLVPHVHEVKPLSTWLEDTRDLLRCLFHPQGEQGLEALAVNSHIALLFGPEGGFSDNEIALARQSGCHVARIGPRVLRAETAPVAALAIAQSRWGDLG